MKGCVLVVLHRKTLDATLAQAALAGSMVVDMVPQGVREGNPAQVVAHSTARLVCSVGPSQSQNLRATAKLEKGPDTNGTGVWRWARKVAFGSERHFCLVHGNRSRERGSLSQPEAPARANQRVAICGPLLALRVAMSKV